MWDIKLYSLRIVLLNVTIFILVSSVSRAFSAKQDCGVLQHCLVVGYILKSNMLCNNL